MTTSLSSPNNKRKIAASAIVQKNSKRRVVEVAGNNSNKIRKTQSLTNKSVKNAVHQAHIIQLEEQISESRKHYNNIASLISMLGVDDSDDGPAAEVDVAVAVSLCKVFCRLLATGQLDRQKNASDQDQIVVAWLRERYQEYKKKLLCVLRRTVSSEQAVAVLTLCFCLAKEQATYLSGFQSQTWMSDFFTHMLDAIVENLNCDSLRTEFMTMYANKNHDISVYLILRLAEYLSRKRSPKIVDNAISMLSEIGVVPPADIVFDNFFSDISQLGLKNRSMMTSVAAFRRKVQQAWLAIMHHDLTKLQRKKLLRIMSRLIAPWFLKPELLMDFLITSYDQGGSTSLLALSGLFYLIQEKNFDYPQFYTKLYSLLDSNLLHSKHRSRFFRLLDTFLSSSHLPATLVASFIKRLSRLALTAPPAAIVAIVPWIYNRLRAHPVCTFMLHRELRDPRLTAVVAEHGFEDPYDHTEPDPLRSGAINSCLWEIESLQSHYHPNVASIARIISEQFTKASYNIEDFLDLSYQSLLESELGLGFNQQPYDGSKVFKRAPVVEFQIPKRIFTNRFLDREDTAVDTEQGAMIRSLWRFAS